MLLDNVKDKYYDIWANVLEARNDSMAKNNYNSLIEDSYITQMGRTPFSIRTLKNTGNENTVALPHSIPNTKNGSNRVVVKTHTHPRELINELFWNSPVKSPPSFLDMLNSQATYLDAANTNLKKTRNTIYTLEGNKPIKYSYAMSDKDNTLTKTLGRNPTEDNAAAYLTNVLGNSLGYMGTSLKSTAQSYLSPKYREYPRSLRRDLHLVDNSLDFYKKKGYTVDRKVL